MAIEGNEVIAPFWQTYSSEEIIDINTIQALYHMNEMPKIVATEEV